MFDEIKTVKKRKNVTGIKTVKTFMKSMVSTTCHGLVNLSSLYRLREQRVLYVLGVVKQTTVPEIMETASVVVKEAAVGAVELVQSVHRVLTGVTVNHVQ